MSPLTMDADTELDLRLQHSLSNSLTHTDGVKLVWKELDATRALLKKLVAQIDKADGNHDGEILGSSGLADPGCIECTSGATPNKSNTGLCAYHQAVRA